MRKILTFLMAIFVCTVHASALVHAQEFNADAQFESVAEEKISTLEASSFGSLSAIEIIDKIAQAKELLRSQPALAGLTTVRLAVLDPHETQIDLVAISKDSFLLKGADSLATTENGYALRLRVVRANGVNTAVTVTDARTGGALLPLVVEFPIEKSGALKETALYTSAHPALISPAVVASGQTYVTTMLDQAAAKLAENGVRIDREIVTIAQHLVIVEHTDHRRFLNEDHTALFPEILSLYALNQDNTFNYSVSTAGAGGMIQMIPRTYEAIRQQHPAIALEPDFVKGMRDHANALKTMLLYMNDTWNKLQESSEVQDALRDGIATKPELLAAGYNSNPLRLPTYLKTGGAGWRSLIPAETQMYLSIYSAVDSTVRFPESASSQYSTAVATTVVAHEPRFMSVFFSLMSAGIFGK